MWLSAVTLQTQLAEGINVGGTWFVVLGFAFGVFWLVCCCLVWDQRCFSMQDACWGLAAPGLDETCRAGADDSEMCQSFLYLQVLLCPLFLQKERAVACFCQAGCQVQMAVRQAAFPLALSELTAERGFGGSVEVRGVSEWSKSVPVLSNRAAKSPSELALFMSQLVVYLWSSWVSLVNIKKC